jgi:hypothetical protein
MRAGLARAALMPTASAQVSQLSGLSRGGTGGGTAAPNHSSLAAETASSVGPSGIESRPGCRRGPPCAREPCMLSGAEV